MIGTSYISRLCIDRMHILAHTCTYVLTECLQRYRCEGARVCSLENNGDNVCIQQGYLVVQKTIFQSILCNSMPISQCVLTVTVSDTHWMHMHPMPIESLLWTCLKSTHGDSDLRNVWDEGDNSLGRVSSSGILSDSANEVGRVFFLLPLERVLVPEDRPSCA